MKDNGTPLLGAGVNLTTRPQGKSWKDEEKKIQFLPNGTELAEHLAAEFSHAELVT